MAVTYEPTVFLNGDDPLFVPGSSPCVGATELNKLGQGIRECANAITAIQNDMTSACFSLIFSDSDWVSAGDRYSISIAASAHNKGPNFGLWVYKLEDSSYVMSQGAYTNYWWRASVSEEGSIALVTKTPFSGKVVIL